MKAELEIIGYNDSLSGYFRDINKSWLEQYFQLEDIDIEMLNNPVKFFINNGGLIFFAKWGNEIVGTCAMLKVTDKVYELSKMAVVEEHRGKKIGQSLLDFCIDRDHKLKLDSLILYSNTILHSAIQLYRKNDFQEVSMGDQVYKRSNIKMEYRLSK